MDKVECQSEILKEWKKFTQDRTEKHPVYRQIILEAWGRCKNYNINPELMNYKFLSKSQIEKRKNASSDLINAAEPYINYFSSSLGDIPHIIVLSDKDGWIVDIKGNREKFGGKQKGFCIGASCLEECVGNNGLGTSLKLGKPVFIYGIEHYSFSYKSFCCIGTPIKLNDKIVGALAMGVPTQFAHPSNMVFMVACGSSIEQDLKCLNDKANDILDKKVSLMSDLMATTIHDLKNPLAIIRGLGQLGVMTTDSPKAKDYFKRIINQSDILNTMISDFLGIVKPQNLAVISIYSIIKEIFDEIQPICNAKNIKITLENHSRKKCMVEKDLMKRCIQNIIKNDVYILKSGGEIKAEVKTKKNNILISISDNGPGIPEDIKETLFEPFTHKSENGTGLGLFMAYHTVVDIHKGRIWFDTETGKGTTFYIELPVSMGI